LTIVSRTLTEPKTALAGVMLDISFARFRVSMVTFSVEMTPFRPFGRWEFVAIVESRGRCEEDAWNTGWKEEPEPQQTRAAILALDASCR